ncbi:MAG: twin-arginine translocation signal domain-containing protein, partial [Pseudomonadota bacterium]
MPTRRDLVTTAAAAGLATGLAPGLSWAEAGAPRYLSAARLTDGSYALFGLDRDGQDLFRIPLPARGHAA